MTVLGPFRFSGGLNTRADLFSMPPDSLYTQKGIRYQQGTLVEAFGSALINSSVMNSAGNKFVQGILPNPISPTSGGSYVFLCVVDGKIFGMTAAGTATDISGAAAFNGGSESQVNNSDVLNGIMVISDGQGASGQLNKWTGAGNVSVLAGSPDGNIVRTCNNFMFTFVAGTSTLNWSAASDATTWPVASSLPFRSGDGDVIATIHYIGTDLYIFKRFSVGRLSTQTQFISGTVTLGPLTAINVGIGAAGPGAVDKLPDGRLVFLSSNSHAYVFDGSTFQDISDQPYPGPNVQSLFDACAPALFGAYSRVAVYPPRNEVWFTISTGPISLNSPGNRCMIWNYKDNTWTNLEVGDSTTRFTQLAYIPTLNATASGLTVGGVFGAVGNMVTGFSGFTYAQDSNNSLTNIGGWQWNASIMFSGEGRELQPKSLLLFHKGTSASTTFSVSYGFDGGTIGNARTITTSTSFVRSVIPISIPSTGQSSVGPSTIQIQVVDTNGGGVQFEPFYLSDEIMN